MNRLASLRSGPTSIRTLVFDLIRQGCALLFETEHAQAKSAPLSAIPKTPRVAKSFTVTRCNFDRFG